MKLNHVNIPVNDVAADRDFFAKYFGMVTVMELGKNFMAMLVDESGMVLNLSHFEKGQSAEIVYHKDFHVGFFVESVEEVDRVYALITGDGLSVDAPRKMHGRYTFYVKAPSGFDVEIGCLDKSLQATVGHDQANS